MAKYEALIAVENPGNVMVASDLRREGHNRVGCHSRSRSKSKGRRSRTWCKELCIRVHIACGMLRSTFFYPGMRFKVEGWTWFMMQVSSSFFGSVRVDCCARKFRVMVAADQFRTLQLTYPAIPAHLQGSSRRIF